VIRVEIQYLARKPYGVSFDELCAAIDEQILAGRNPQGVAFGSEGQLFEIDSAGRIRVEESPD